MQIILGEYYDENRMDSVYFASSYFSIMSLNVNNLVVQFKKLISWF